MTDTNANHRLAWLAPLTLVLLVAAVYLPGIDAPMIFDDRPAIRDNESIDSLISALTPPPQSPMTNRPVPNLLLAINKAIGDLEPQGYHFVNTLLHAISVVLLWSVLLRTFRHTSLRHRLGDAAPLLAFAIAGVWAVHPLNVEAVQYITQRTELCMGLFMLLTLWCAQRYWRMGDGVGEDADGDREPGGPTRWLIAATIACLLGMFSKEVMVVAPILLLLYDRAFVSGTFGRAWRSHRWLYLLSAGTVPLLVISIVSSWQWGEVIGYEKMSAWEYLRIQARVVLHYIELAVWPGSWAITFDVPVPERFVDYAPHGSFILLLLGAAVWALVRHPKWGVVGALFFLVLGPTSSVLPITTEVGAERRMYMALPSIIILVVIGAWWMITRFGGGDSRARRAVFAAVISTILIAATVVSVIRVQAWRDPERVWRVTLAKYPDSPMALNNLAVYLVAQDDATDAEMAEAERMLLRAMERKRSSVRGYGQLHMKLKNYEKARDAYAEYVRIAPRDGSAYYQLGVALEELGQRDEALKVFRKAVELAPDHVLAHNNVGNLLMERGDLDGAIKHYNIAAEKDPEYARAPYNLGVIAARQGDIDKAIGRFKQAIERDESFASAHYNLALALARSMRSSEALPHLIRAAEIEPDNAEYLGALGKGLVQQNRPDAAVDAYVRSIAIAPDAIDTHVGYVIALVRAGRGQDAADHLEELVEKHSDKPIVHDWLGRVYLQLDRRDAAIRSFERAIAADPDYEPARQQLDRLRSSPDR